MMPFSAYRFPQKNFLSLLQKSFLCATNLEFLVFSTRFCYKPADFAKELAHFWLRPLAALCSLCLCG
jgi:hypothetical protein